MSLRLKTEKTESPLVGLRHSCLQTGPPHFKIKLFLDDACVLIRKQKIIIILAVRGQVVVCVSKKKAGDFYAAEGRERECGQGRPIVCECVCVSMCVCLQIRGALAHGFHVSAGHR